MTFLAGTLRSKRLSVVIAGTAAAILSGTAAVAAEPAEAASAECTQWVALTFDDGPSHYRPQTLRILRDKQVPATFFDIGVRVDANPHVSAFAQRDSHLVLNHTYTHPRLSSFSARRVREQILDAERALTDAGVSMPFMGIRAPFGAVDAEVLEVFEELGYSHIGADTGSTDFLPTTSAQAIHDALTSSLDDGDILIMHDGPIDTMAGANVIGALPMVIDTVRERGFCFGLVNADADVVPATYTSSGEAIPAITDAVPFRPILFGGDLPTYPYVVLPPDLPGFDNLADLLDDLRAGDRMSAATYAGLVDRLSKARRLAEQGSETRTIGYLQHIVDRARNQVRDAEARALIVTSAQALIVELLAAEEAENGTP
jgi:peptidoglycan/xylan/chitin deacetylase (PgdA/CDA1 family)